MDRRDLPPSRYGLDINDIDFNWVKACKNVKELKDGIRLLKDDGGFQELMAAAEDKLAELDPEFRRRRNLPQATPAEKAEAKAEIASFESEMADQEAASKQSPMVDEEAEARRRVKAAQDERVKGNEFMNSQDYKEAISYYGRSLKLDPREAATYCNRALAFIKLKDYKSALVDANITLEMKSDYLKAYHRRAEAYFGLEEYAKAYTDIQVILKKEPANNSAKETFGKIEKKLKALNISIDTGQVDQQVQRVLEEAQRPKPSKEPKAAPEPAAAPKVKLPKEPQQEPKSALSPAVPQLIEGFVQVPITESAGDSSSDENEGDEDPKTEQKKEAKKETKKEAHGNIWSEDELKAPNDGIKEEKDEKVEMTAEELDQLLPEYNVAKEAGKQLHKEGKYEDAIKKYKECLTMLAGAADKQAGSHKPGPKSELAKRESIINTNIAVGYKQMQDSTNVIIYTSKVIDSGVEDSNMLSKALTLRAFAYESVDKLLQSKEDWARVQALQPGNLEASKALGRVKEALQRDKAQRAGETLRSLRPSLEKYKQAGNDFYKAKDYMNAVAQFTEGIELFLKRCDVESLHWLPKDELLVVAQLYTNRAIANHFLGRHLDVVDDAGFVLAKIDPQNAKAFYRRGIALTNLGDYEKALIDLEESQKLDPKNEHIKADINNALTKAIEVRKKTLKGEAKKTAPEAKRGEPEASAPTFKKPAEESKAPQPSAPPSKQKKVGIEELAPDSGKAAQSPVPPGPKPAKAKKLTEEEINKAAAKAAQAVGAGHLTKPKTSYAFENIWRSYKKDYATLYKYLKVSSCSNIQDSVEPDYLVLLFKDNEIAAEVFLSLVTTLRTHAMEYHIVERDNVDTTWH